jgi:hypothetical protein
MFFSFPQARQRLLNQPAPPQCEHFPFCQPLMQTTVAGYFRARLQRAVNIVVTAEKGTHRSTRTGQHLSSSSTESKDVASVPVPGSLCCRRRNCLRLACPQRRQLITGSSTALDCIRRSSKLFSNCKRGIPRTLQMSLTCRASH